QIIEPDVVEEFEALPDLDQHLVGDGALFGAEREGFEKLLRLSDVQAQNFTHIPPADLHVERFLSQTRALAFGAKRVPAITAQEHADVQLVLLGFEVIKKATHEIVDLLALLLREVAEW